MSRIDWIVLVLTLACIIAYGLYKSRTSKDLEGYFLSNRTMPWYLVLLSVMGTQASAITFLSAPGQAYTDGMRFVQYYFGLPLAMVILCVSFLPVFSRLRVFTAYEYLEERFDVQTRTFASSLFLLSRGLSTGISIYAPSIIVSSLFGWNIYWTNLAMGGVLIIYTMSGGARAVAYTQQLQLLIIFAGMAFAGYLIVHGLPAGVGLRDALALGGASGKLNIITTGVSSKGFDWHDRYNIFSGVIGGLFLSLSYFGTDQSQVGRYITAKDLKQSRLGLLMNGLVKIPMQFLILLIGALLFSFYLFNPAPVFFNKAVSSKTVTGVYHDSLLASETRYKALSGERSVAATEFVHTRSAGSRARLAEESGKMELEKTHYKALVKKADASADTNDTNYIFLRFVVDYLPAGLVGLLIAIIFLAAWGSIAAALNSLASATVVDFFCRFKKKKSEGASDYHLSRWTTLGWGLFCVAVADFAGQMGSLIEAVNVLGSLFYGVMLGLFLVALYIPSIKGRAVLWSGIISELVVIALFILDSKGVIGVGFLWFNVIGAALTVGLAWIITIMPRKLSLFILPGCIFAGISAHAQTVIRVNQLGYAPGSVKVAVLGSKSPVALTSFDLVDAATRKVVYTGKPGNDFGAYGPFIATYRLDFSNYRRRAKVFVRAAGTESPVFSIGETVYDGAADFCLRYMRQQRSGFNPFLKDSCHTHDGYTLYGPMPDSTRIDAVGGWHDASDYLQYSTTSANATYCLLAAYRDFPSVFTDTNKANGLDGRNGLPDVLDEAKWGLDWLLKMHPKDDWLFNQLGDDRDHRSMRLPKEDNYYGKGYERPVYFASGLPQQRGKFKNNTTGVASTAGKFASAFALGSALFARRDSGYAHRLAGNALTALQLGLDKPGACQTASVLSPYIYAEDNWTDDMELGEAAIASLAHSTDARDAAYSYAVREPVTPWLGRDTAAHYQWYPFVNAGHYELARQLTGPKRDTLISFYKRGIESVWRKAKANAFYRGVPFIWCSNNLTVSFATQCYWYRKLSGDNTYQPLEQACFDWIFGCNPWGTGMVYGLPQWGDTPSDPHSAFTHLGKYPIDGGLVDGPVYGSIYGGLIGIHLTRPDDYTAFQSKLAVYHDDYGDYSTNEPTMDGTASLVYLLAAEQAQAGSGLTMSHGAIVRGDSTRRRIALVFTGDEFGDGLPWITRTLQQQDVHGSFFFTGRFYRNPAFRASLHRLQENGNYLSSHSDMHLLYNDWDRRDSLLVSRQEFTGDMQASFASMRAAGIKPSTPYYIPPYEWWNDSIATWSRSLGLQVIANTPGVRTNADYTYPSMSSYKTSEWLMQDLKRQASGTNDLNGAIILVHAGTDPRRKDKLYARLPEMISYLRSRGYTFCRVDELLKR